MITSFPDAEHSVVENKSLSYESKCSVAFAKRKCIKTSQLCGQWLFHGFKMLQWDTIKLIPYLKRKKSPLNVRLPPLCATSLTAGCFDPMHLVTCDLFSLNGTSQMCSSLIDPLPLLPLERCLPFVRYWQRGAPLGALATLLNWIEGIFSQ